MYKYILYIHIKIYFNYKNYHMNCYCQILYSIYYNIFVIKKINVVMNILFNFFIIPNKKF